MKLRINRKMHCKITHTTLFSAFFQTISTSVLLLELQPSKEKLFYTSQMLLGQLHLNRKLLQPILNGGQHTFLDLECPKQPLSHYASSGHLLIQSKQWKHHSNEGYLCCNMIVQTFNFSQISFI